MSFEKKYEESNRESPENIWREPVPYEGGTAHAETTLRLACVWSAEETRVFCGVRNVRAVGEEIRGVKGPDCTGMQLLFRGKWEPLEDYEQRSDII